MSSISALLLESFRLLWREPKLFVPKLISTFLSSVWIIAALSGTLTTAQMLITFPFVMLTGVFVSLMVASMVKNKESEKILREGFLNAAKSWKAIIPTAIFFLITGFVVVVPLGIGLTYYIRFGNFTLLVIGSVLSVFLVIAVSFFSYFLPITLLEKGSFFSGFKRSLQSSRKSSRTVLTLTIFSMILLILAFASSEYLQALGYIGFLTGRLMATVVNTYLFVISPSYYLDQN